MIASSSTHPHSTQNIQQQQQQQQPAAATKKSYYFSSHHTSVQIDCILNEGKPGHFLIGRYGCACPAHKITASNALHNEYDVALSITIVPTFICMHIKMRGIQRARAKR